MGALKRRAKLHPGDRVVFTGDYLRSTGQTVGGEGQRTFTVQAHEGCGLCERGTHVAVDDVSEFYEGPRHIAVGNLRKKGELLRDDRVHQGGFHKLLLERKR